MLSFVAATLCQREIQDEETAYDGVEHEISWTEKAKKAGQKMTSGLVL